MSNIFYIMKSIFGICSNKNSSMYLYFLAVAFMTALPQILLTIVGIYVAYRVVKHFLIKYEIIEPPKSKSKSKKKSKKEEVQPPKANIVTASQKIAEIHSYLDDNNGKLYYSVQGYSNSNDTLTVYARFYDNRYNNINLPLTLYLQKANKTLVWYNGKSKKYQDTVMLVNMDLYHIEQSIEKMYGKPVQLERIDKCS